MFRFWRKKRALTPIIQPLDDTAVIHVERCRITIPPGYVFVSASPDAGVVVKDSIAVQS